MFPSFTGSSRKPRQVNLSGRRSTPQAKQIPGLSTQSNQHSSALLLAQQQRAKREAERKELEAAKKIQSTWRGRRDIARRRVLWRKEWDDKFGKELSRRKVRDVKEAMDAIRLFLGFFDRTWSSGKAQKMMGPRQPGEDMQRLVVLVQAMTIGTDNMVPQTIDLQNFHTLHRFAAIILSTILCLSPTSPHALEYILIFLGLIAEIPTVALSVIQSNGFSSEASHLVSPTYYETLSYITTSFNTSQNSTLQDLLFRCLLGPFSAHIPVSLQGIAPIVSQVYRAFSRFTLTSPNLRESLGENYFNALAAMLDIGELADAVLDGLEGGNRVQNTAENRRLEREPDSINTSDESRLWLLAYIIFFVRKNLQNGSFQNRQSGNSYVRCLTLLLGQLAKEVGFRIDLQDHDMGGIGNSMRIHDDYDDETDLDRERNFYQRKGPLSDFVKEQLYTLIDQSSISSLLSRTSSITRISGRLAESSEALEAQLLASYSLTLLLVFPTKREELRMWLYLSSTADGIPAVRYLWEAVKRSKLFTEVSADPNAAVKSLKKKRESKYKFEPSGWRTGSDPTSQQRQTQQYQASYNIKINEEIPGDDNNDWRVALLFLELYSFLLIVMDDDDFFNAGKDPSISNGEWSRTRDSAPPLDDVKGLTVFLKNLAFAMYWYSGEILRPDQNVHGAETLNGDVNSAPDELEVAGVKGMGFNYVKGLVTNLLRMIYLRDSRRRFLPHDHWLMTSRFDMEGFIPAVVAEEENRQRLEAEEGDNASDDGTNAFTGHSNRFDNLQKQLHGQQKNPYLAAVAPRLEILQHLPFFIPFSTRVQIFREFVSVDQTRRRQGNTDPDAWRTMVLHTRRHDSLSKHHARIRRESVFEDAFEEFYPLGEGLKEPIQITFIDQFGAQEAGIDGGGVTKEFLTSVTKEAFVPERYNLFLENKHHMLYPNPNSIEECRANERDAGQSSHNIDNSIIKLLRQYEFLGRIVGKCMYEGILVDINFAGVFLLQWSYGKNGGNSYKPGVNDLKDLDEELYQGLVGLKNYTGDVETDFALNFTITNSLSLSNGKSKTITIDLKPNGSNHPVTNSNRLEYIHLVSKYRLLLQPRAQINAFLQGLGSIIQPSWLSMFNQTELQILVGGGDSPIDVADLRRHTVYGGLYVIGDDGMEHPVVQNFWKVMEDDLTDEERRKVLKFVTSVSRAPLLGFGMLNPRFSIRDSSDDQERLPSTSTCVNLLKLPRYQDRETLRKKLLYAVNAGAGFDLS